MPCLKLFRPLATSPIIAEKRFPPNSSRMMIARIRICQKLNEPMGETPLGRLLVLLFLAFQLELIESLEDTLVQRVEQARGLEVVDSRKILAGTQPEVGEKLLRRRIKQRSARA